VKKTLLMLLAAAVSAGGFSLWAQLDDTVPLPKEFRKWVHVKSVLVGAQSAAFLETKEVGGNTIEGPTRRVDVMVKQSALHRTTGGWEFMSFPGGNPTNGKLTAERQATCAACHANRKDHDFVFSEFRK
jgi:hypothetical protein